MPNPVARFSLMSLVLAKPFQEDLFHILFMKSVNLSKAQEVAEGVGIGYIFNVVETIPSE